MRPNFSLNRTRHGWASFHSEAIRTLQRKLYVKAKQAPAYRFYALYDNVWRADILMFAYRLVRANKGNPGIDGIDFEDIEQKRGVDTFLLELAQDLKTRPTTPVRYGAS